MRKVIFLDIDGVLNTKWWYTQMNRNTPKDKYGYAFDPNAVSNLKKILDQTGADIVISSSWKSFGYSELEEMWEERGLPGKLIGITPNSVSDEMLLNADLDNMELLSIRAMEIKEWLSKNGKRISHYAIIDDMDNMLPEQQSHFVKTDPEIGITKENANQVIAILGI
jgi:aryl carrier-like protein